MTGVPYRIVTERLVVRCYDPADAPLLKDAVDSSLDSLRAWLPWAWQEPRELASTIQLLRGFRARFDRDEDYILGIFDRDEGRVLGGTGLHERLGEGAKEIGYWLRDDAAGRGLMTECAAALVRVGFEVLAVDRIEIHCDARNDRSAAVARRLGFRHEARLARRSLAHDGTRTDDDIYTLFADDEAAAAIRTAGAPLEVYDAVGDRLL